MQPIFGLSFCAARSRISDALAALLGASPESGPPGSPNLSPRVFCRASGSREWPVFRRPRQEPLPLLRQPLAQRDARLPPQSLARDVDRCPGVARVAERGGKVAPPGLDPADLLERVQHAVDRDAAAAAEVDDLADVVRRRRLHRAVDRVRDERELAGLLAVAEDLD